MNMKASEVYNDAEDTWKGVCTVQGLFFFVICFFKHVALILEGSQIDIKVTRLSCIQNSSRLQVRQ
jgi:hypothetical protein